MGLSKPLILKKITGGANRTTHILFIFLIYYFYYLVNFP